MQPGSWSQQGSALTTSARAERTCWLLSPSGARRRHPAHLPSRAGPRPRCSNGEAASRTLCADLRAASRVRPRPQPLSVHARQCPNTHFPSQGSHEGQWPGSQPKPHVPEPSWVLGPAPAVPSKGTCAPERLNLSRVKATSSPTPSDPHPRHPNKVHRTILHRIHTLVFLFPSHAYLFRFSFLL